MQLKANQTMASTALLLGMCVWNLIVAIDSTALSTALPTIASDLAATSVEAFWVGTSFVLCSAAFQPILASASGAFGRKPVLSLALLTFTAGAIICALANGVTPLLVGRCLQGVGGGGILTLTYVLMADEFTLPQRHRAISVISLTWLVGPVVGPILAGGLTENVSWRWIFWFNIPFCAVGAVLLAGTPLSYRAPSIGAAKFKSLDYIGSALFISSLTAFLISISWGGTMFSWTSWQTLFPLITGALGIVGWVLYSLFLTSNPMVPLRLIMSSRTVLISYFGNLVHGIAFYGMLYQLPLFFQTVEQFSPIMSGVALLPICAVAGPSAAIVGVVIARTQRIKPVALAMWAVFAAGIGLLSLLQRTMPAQAWTTIQLPAGLGLGALYAALALATQSAVETARCRSESEVETIKAIAAGLNPFFRTVGQTFGVVISQAAITNELRKRLGEQAAANATALAQVIKSLAPDSPERLVIVSAFSDSLRPVWWILAALCGFMFVLTLATKDLGFGGVASGVSDVELSCDSSISFTQEKEISKRRFSIFGFGELLQEGIHEGFHNATADDAPDMLRSKLEKKRLVVTVKELAA